MNPLPLKEQFFTYTSRISNDLPLQQQIFTDLLARYSESYRHYHTLTHVDTLLADAGSFFHGDIPAELFFAIWFHDAIYSASSSKNEEHSAKLAVTALRKLHCDENMITKCKNLILKTADHLNAEATDEVTRFFLDADLKILGSDAATYRQYAEDVRKEFSSIPTLLFNIGRRKFLRNALKSERFFRTPQYFDLYEQAARKNLTDELNQLS